MILCNCGADCKCHKTEKFYEGYIDVFENDLMSDFNEKEARRQKWKS